MKISLYKTPDCHRCPGVLVALKDEGHEVEVVNIKTAEGLTDLRTRGCYSMMAPIICIEEETARERDRYTFYEPAQIFRDNGNGPMRPLGEIDPRLGAST